MKRIFLFCIWVVISSITAFSLQPSDLRIYINPGHGSWTSNDRPMSLIDHPTYRLSNGEVDTLRFFESNTNLEKAFGVMEKLIEYGVPFDRSKNQTNAVATRVGAALDLSQNIVMSRVKNGPYPVTTDANYSGGYNRPLTEIAVEVEQNNFDMFLSIHSNGNNTGANSTENYLLLLFRGEGTNAANWRAEVPGSVEMASAAWKYLIADSHQQWSTGTLNQIIRGDWTFYGSHSVGVNGCDGYLGVLKHHVPGYLAEGYFHTYAPSRHRAMNPDAARSEGVQYARGVADYFGFNTESTGDILGIVHDLEDEITNVLYIPTTGVDKYAPINGCLAVLKHEGREIASYTTDHRHNGVFYFAGIAPGKYTLSFSHPEYEAKEMEVEVRAGATAYPTALLSHTQPDIYPTSLAAFASNLSATEHGQAYTISFTSNTGAENARLLTRSADDETAEIDLGEVSKGENTFSVSKTLLTPGESTWSIELTSAPVSESGCCYAEDNPSIGTAARGGVWMVTDPESEFFGRIYVGYGWISEIAEYSPDLEEISRVKASWAVKTNGYTPSRLSFANDRIYFADYSDPNSGIYFLDLKDRDSGITSMFDISTRDSNGALYRAGKVVGGSTSHVAFTGSGEETVMWCFPEDYPSNSAATDESHVVRGWKIGTGKQITSDAHYSMPKNGLANCWQYLITTSEGMWVCQKRSTGNNSSTYPGIIYMDMSGTKLYSSHVIAGDMTTVSGSIAISADQSLMAVDQGNDGIYLYNIKWSGNTPTLSLNSKIPGTENDLGSENYPQLQFDPAGNLMAYKRGGGLQLFALKSDSPRVSVVPARNSFVLRGGSTGILDSVNNAASTQTVYYNLQGIKVDNPRSGIYIKVEGSRATKVRNSGD